MAELQQASGAAAVGQRRERDVIAAGGEDPAFRFCR